MKIHEFQAKALFAAAGIPVPQGIVARSPDEAAAAFTSLGGELAVVKAQIHAGGRGKGGGVKLVRSADEAKEAATAILSAPLITHQTGPEGQPVKTLLVEAGSDIAHEYYVGLTLDRALGMPVLMASTEGGVEIETVAANTPEKILKQPVDPEAGLRPWQARQLAYGLGLPASAIRGAQKIFTALSTLFLEKDASLVEVNPLVLTGAGDVIALDGKVTFDSNALYRQPAIVELRDIDEEDAREADAQEAGLAYIALDGNIGCLVNGAGLAMGTMDTIKLAGGEPANFLDVGGGATAEQVTTAFKIILSDPKVEAILVNIFGGIMKCDVIAEGILAAASEIGISVPLVVRLEGTNVERGRELLEGSDLDIITASDLADAAAKAVESLGAKA
ncbi:MAG: succinate--CoA ligase [ADP-forming] subunit beta [Planctomycetota bacterium]|nr:MAG: succinate--CoA ligase [ADP-forming] subunit beta [Planctomycetota bacterium]